MLSFLGLILERIEYDNYERLIEEGRDPIEVLHYKFQQIPSDIIDSVIAIDPTKKKSYSQWLLSKWDEESDTIVNNLKNGRIAKLFQHYKEHQDIQIKDCPSVKEGLDTFVPEEDTVLTKSSNPTTTLMNRGWTEEVPSELANDFDIVFNSDEWIIAVPNTYEADCKLGENMNWCTAGGRSSFNGGRGYYDRYLNDYGGKYYVNFDMSVGESRLGKDYPFTRYQFHFESNQFMDKEDDPVELCEIGMPESAKEFYSDEGYDTDKFENLEARIDRYEEQRGNSYYGLNDDLYLNIAYDEEYHYEQPHEDTDFYVFSNDDDRDPISWDEVPNPFTNEDAVILKSDWLCILKKKYGEIDDGVLIAIQINNSGWGRWETYSFGKYIVLPDNIGIFGANTDGIYSFVSSTGNIDFNKLKISECEKIFINEQCTNADADIWGQIFVETVADGYHSLFAICPDNGTGDDCEMIIKKDTPVNGECFAINENGLIEGTFRTYRVYDNDFYGSEDTNPKYDLEELLPTGDYLVSTMIQGEYYGKEKQYFNILKHGSYQPLIEPWFDEYIAYSKNLYGVKKDKKVGFFNRNSGQQVGRWYDSYGGVDKEKDILFGKIGPINKPDKVDIISGFKNSVIGTFKDILSRKSANNKVIVEMGDGATRKVFDYVEGQFYFPELDMFMRVDQYDHPYIFACNIVNTEERALFDLQSLKVLVRGVKDFGKLSRVNTNFIKLTKLNGKVNAFDMNKLTQVIQTDVDEITSMNEYTTILVYSINGKYYPLNYRTSNILINPNGIGVPTYVNDSDKIYCSGEEYNIYFAPKGNTNNYVFYNWENKRNYRDYGTNFDPQHTPQEVMNMYGLIFGQQPQMQQVPQEQEAYAVAEEFKRLVKRIDEASKMRYNDLLD